MIWREWPVSCNHDLGSVKNVAYIQTVMKNGSSADRQLAEYQRAKDEGADDKEALQAAVDPLCRETVLGI